MSGSVLGNVLKYVDSAYLLRRNTSLQQAVAQKTEDIDVLSEKVESMRSELSVSKSVGLRELTCIDSRQATDLVKLRYAELQKDNEKLSKDLAAARHPDADVASLQQQVAELKLQLGEAHQRQAGFVYLGRSLNKLICHDSFTNVSEVLRTAQESLVHLATVEERAKQSEKQSETLQKTIAEMTGRIQELETEAAGATASAIMACRSDLTELVEVSDCPLSSKERWLICNGSTQKRRLQLTEKT